MADEFSISISGIDEACALLDRVPKETARVGIARSLAAAAVPIVEAVDARTPVGATEELKAALNTDISLDSDGYGGSASINFGKQGHVANFVEYGHRMIGHKPGKKELGEVKPHPFMRPAAAASADAAVEAFTETLERELVSGTTWADVAEAVA
jgi:HK97 gp10 family phage protein